MARLLEREWDMHNLGKDDGKGIWENGFRDGLAFARDTRLISKFLLPLSSLLFLGWMASSWLLSLSDRSLRQLG